MIIFLDYWTSQQINNSNGGHSMNYEMVMQKYGIATGIMAIFFMITLILIIVMSVKRRRAQKNETVFIKEGSKPGTLEINSAKTRSGTLIAMCLVALVLLIGTIICGNKLKELLMKYAEEANNPTTDMIIGSLCF